jgi:hypothetical protein
MGPVACLVVGLVAPVALGHLAVWIEEAATEVPLDESKASARNVVEIILFLEVMMPRMLPVL